MRGFLFVATCFMVLVCFACASEPKIDGKTAVEWLSLLKHEDWTTQARAAENLLRLGKDALPFLKRGARGTDPKRPGPRTLAGVGYSSVQRFATVPWPLRGHAQPDESRIFGPEIHCGDLRAANHEFHETRSIPLSVGAADNVPLPVKCVHLHPPGARV